MCCASIDNFIVKTIFSLKHEIVFKKVFYVWKGKFQLTLFNKFDINLSFSWLFTEVNILKIKGFELLALN